MKKAAGFTLIELVMVIVILGILAATALPKFASLSADARMASIKSLAGALESTANIIHLKCIASPNCDETAATAIFTMEDGNSYRLNYGWPDAGNSVSGKQIESLIDLSGYKITEISNGETRFEIENAPDSVNCSVIYADAFYGSGSIDITSKTSGC